MTGDRSGPATTLGVDVGGTFTDFAFWDGSQITVGKTPTTPDQSEGVVSGAGDILRGNSAARLLHGTTVATNAVLERTGARVGLVTSPGMEDVLEIGRQDRPSLYDPQASRPDPFVERELRHAIGSDRNHTGLGEWLASTQPETVAVSLLYSYADPFAEIAARSELRDAQDDLPIVLSSEVAAELREFERTSTTVLDAYLIPVAGVYLRALEGRARRAGLADHIQVMRSSGGLMALEAAARHPAAALLSGPAGGAVAAAALGRAHGLSDVISFDMGGTSTDVCHIEHGEPRLTYERSVGGHACRLPSVAINTVGAGGGSIAWADSGGALRVGPSSAGADPGPACYGRGGSTATVTDGHVALGRIGSESELGGGLAVQADLAERAIERLATKLGMSAVETATGIIDVVDTHMERAINVVSLAEGADPREAVLVSFGGAGGLHASTLARRFGMAQVIVPPHAGVFSAVGLLLSPVRADAARSLEDLQPSGEALHSIGREISDRAVQELAAMGYETADIRTLVDVRYRGQSHETTVALDPSDDLDAVRARFNRAHQRRNGFNRPGDPTEMVTVRAEAVSAAALTWDQLGWTPQSGQAVTGTRPVLIGSGAADATVLWRPCLSAGEEHRGPAVIEEPDATTFIGDGERCRVLEDGSLEVTW